MFGFLSLIDLAMIGLYVYVAVAVGRASERAGRGWIGVMWDSITWPVMIWNVIEKLRRAGTDEEPREPTRPTLVE